MNEVIEELNGADWAEMYEEELRSSLKPVACYCGICGDTERPVMLGDKPQGDIVDHFIYDFDGTLDYISIYHRACAVARGLQIDANGRVVRQGLRG